MRLQRRFLLAGLFFVALGAVLVAADTRVVDTAVLADAIRLWPVAVIAIGLSLALRRTQLSLPAGMLAAAVPGLVLGGALAVVPRFVGDCGARDDAGAITGDQGVFDGPARVSVTTACGMFNLTTAPGNGWQLQSSNTNGRFATLVSSGRSLNVNAAARGGWQLFDAGRDTWNMTLPEGALDALSLVANANRSTVNLAGTQIALLDVTANTSDVVVDASAAAVARLDGVVNLASMSIRLPADSDLSASVRVHAGRLELCVPSGLGVRFSGSGFARTVTVEGLRQDGSMWQSANYSSAAHRADITVSASFGAVDINPIGGCR